MRNHLRENMLIPYIAMMFILLGLVIQPIDVFIDGFINIQLSKSILLTDYVAVGGEGPALVNAGVLMLISYIIVKKLKMKITGPIFAGIFTIGGFAFFGKNLINVSIIYMGVLLYSRYKKVPLRSLIIVFLFATGLSPISSVLMFGMGLPLYYSIPLGIGVGLLSGFLLVELASHVITFHMGYDLYNVGFACGILTFAYFGVFKLVGLTYETNLIYTNDAHILLLALFIFICVLMIMFGIYINDNSLKGYFQIFNKSGRAVTDFTVKNKQGITMFNVGITSLVALSIIVLQDIYINGPVLGGLLTIFGFGAFGKHIRNVFPPMVGVTLVVLIFDLDLSVAIVLAILFSTALAPVAGEYGIIIGILAGMLHVPIVSSLGQLHGGMLLYANGFAAAFTALIMHTFIATFERSRLNGIARKA